MTKLNWDKVRIDNSISKLGSQSVYEKKPHNEIKNIFCKTCGETTLMSGTKHNKHKYYCLDFFIENEKKLRSKRIKSGNDKYEVKGLLVVSSRDFVFVADTRYLIKEVVNTIKKFNINTKLNYNDFLLRIPNLKNLKDIVSINENFQKFIGLIGETIKSELNAQARLTSNYNFKYETILKILKKAVKNQQDISEFSKNYECSYQDSLQKNSIFKLINDVDDMSREIKEVLEQNNKDKISRKFSKDVAYLVSVIYV